MLDLEARAMPSPTRPVHSSGAGANPAGPPAQVAQWLNPINQGIGAWIGQQVQARKAANQQRQSAHRPQQTKQLIQQLNMTAGAPVTVTVRPNGTPSEIKGSFLRRAFVGPALPGSDHLLETARSFLRSNKSLLSLNDPDSELVLRTRQTDELGRHHLRFRQEYQGIPVWPAELIVHVTSAGSVDLLDGAFVPTPQVKTTPKVIATDAIEKARQRLNVPHAATAAAPELIIYGPLDNTSRLAWKFDLVSSVANAWRCVVDATDGALLAHFSLVTEDAVNGSGVDGLGQNRTLHVWQQGSIFYLEDTSKQMFNTGSTPPNPDKIDGAIFIWDSQNTPPTNNPAATTNFLGNPILSTSSSASIGWVPDAVARPLA
jgi:hypothetical protein